MIDDLRFDRHVKPSQESRMTYDTVEPQDIPCGHRIGEEDGHCVSRFHIPSLDHVSAKV